MGARVAEVELAVGHAHEKFDADGRLVDDDVRQALRDALDDARRGGRAACASPPSRLSALGVRRRLVLGEPPLDDRAREHADELAVLDDRNALVVLLLEERERVGERRRESIVAFGGSAISPSVVVFGSRPCATTSRTSVLRVTTPTSLPSSQTSTARTSVARSASPASCARRGSLERERLGDHRVADELVVGHG